MLRLRGHTDSVYSVAYSPDGRLLASGSGDGTARVWDLGTHQTRHVFEGHKDTVWRVAFAGDGRTLVTGGFDGLVRLWDLSSGECWASFSPGRAQVRSLAVAPDGTTLAAAGHDGSWGVQAAYLYDAATGKQRGVIRPADPTLSWARDNLPRGEGRPFPRTRRPARRAFEFHPPGVVALAFTPDSRTVALAGEGFLSVTFLWDIRGERAEAVLNPAGQVRALAFAPPRSDPSLLAMAADEKVLLWDVATLRVRGELRGHGDWIWAVAFAPDGGLLATASRDETVRFWDPARGRDVAAWRWGIGPVWSVAFAPDGLTAAAGGQDGSLLIWDIDC